VVSELYYPEDTSTGYFLTGIAEGLAESHNVRVLCAQPTYSARGIRAPKQEIHNKVHIYRCWSTTLKKETLLLRLLNLLTISLSSFMAGLWRVRPGDHILSVTNPPLLPFMMAAVAWFRRANLVLVVHDVYPDVLIAAGYLPHRALLSQFLNFLVRLLFLSAKRIIVLGRDMKTLVQSKIANNEPPVIIIHNWADISRITPKKRPENLMLKAYGLNCKFVIQYSGNIGRTHGLEVILECARSLKDDGQIHFIFIGRGAKRGFLEKTVKNQDLANVTVLDYLPRDQLAISLNACDIAIIALIPGMTGISVPSRMYNVMAAGKPIIAIADQGSELARVVREENIGYVVPPGDVDNLRSTILEAREDPEQLTKMGLRARLAAENKYSAEMAIKAYIDMIDSLPSKVV
jgi:colanic acid biosynthesis glycosyl transferase WcaI